VSTELNAPSDEYLAITMALREMIKRMAKERLVRIRLWDLAPCPDDF
jgi:hypothetical protein